MKEKNQKSIGALVSFLIAGVFWRRWYGTRQGIGKVTRFWKYLVLAIVVLSMYYSKDLLDWNNWRVYAVIASFMYHWARSHGDYFYVWSTGVDEGRIKWIDWILRRIYGEGQYYNFKGNVTGLLLRYTSTACLVALCIPNPWFICAGILTTLAYIITGKMGVHKEPVQKAEWLSGALNFGLLYLCI